MGVFKDMHEQRTVDPGRDYLELRRMLSEAIERGYVEQVPVMKRHPMSLRDEWYRDKETGEIYVLIAPDDRPGCWDRIDPSELVDPGETVQ